MRPPEDLLEALRSLRPTRSLPWRYVGDPWPALLAEVLLVRTNAAKVEAAYAELSRRFATPCDLLSAGEAELESILRPLGLQRRRARLLKELAEAARDRFGCRVPCSYGALRSLPGVGDYIASAVAISVCGERPPAPPLDVNVARVLSRAALGRDPPEGYARDQELAEAAASVPWTRDLLYAVIDLSAEYCRPRRPRCGLCPLRGACRYAARSAGKAP